MQACKAKISLVKEFPLVKKQQQQQKNKQQATH